MRTTQQLSLDWFAIGCFGLSTCYLIGLCTHKFYFESKPPPVALAQVQAKPTTDPTRKAIEDKHRQLLQKSGLKYKESEVDLTSIPTLNLELVNQKLEKALRSGS